MLTVRVLGAEFASGCPSAARKMGGPHFGDAERTNEMIDQEDER